MTLHLLKSDAPFPRHGFERLSKIKVFVPFFVGLYESLFGFRVLGTLLVYLKARLKAQFQTV